jgi:hypothetical protein
LTHDAESSHKLAEVSPDVVRENSIEKGWAEIIQPRYIFNCLVKRVHLEVWVTRGNIERSRQVRFAGSDRTTMFFPSISYENNPGPVFSSVSATAVHRSTPEISV